MDHVYRGACYNLNSRLLVENMPIGSMGGVYLPTFEIHKNQPFMDR